MYGQIHRPIHLSYILSYLVLIQLNIKIRKKKKKKNSWNPFSRLTSTPTAVTEMPPPPRSSKPGSLTAALDTKILILVRRYIDDAIEDGDTSLFNKSTSSLRLSVSQLSQYVSAVGDGRLQRTKKSMIEKSIERAIEVINYEQEQVQYREKDKPVRRKKRGKSVPVEEEEEARPDEEDEEVMAMDSDFEGIDVDELVEIKVGGRLIPQIYLCRMNGRVCTRYGTQYDTESANRIRMQ